MKKRRSLQEAKVEDPNSDRPPSLLQKYRSQDPTEQLRQTSERADQVPQILNQMRSVDEKRIPTFLRHSFMQRRNVANSGIRNQVNKDLSQIIVEMFDEKEECPLCQITYGEPLISIADCSHKFCTQCMKQYVSYKINMNQEVKCADQNCDKLMAEQTQFFTSLPLNLIDKYRVNKLWRENKGNPNVKLCPRQECKEGLVDLLQDPPRCRNCGRTFCKQCEMEAHEGSCGDNFQQMHLDWKKCPECKVFIEKTEGCNHMTCRCAHEFCYVCLNKWEDIHYQCKMEGEENNYVYMWRMPFLPIVQQQPTECTRFLRCLLLVLIGPFYILLLLAVLLLSLALCWSIGILLTILCVFLCGKCSSELCLILCALPFITVLKVHEKFLRCCR